MKKKLFSFFAALFLIGLLTVTANASTEDTEITYCSTLEEMGASLRAQLVERRETCTVGYVCERFTTVPDETAVWNEALIHTGVPNEGDYLKSCVSHGASRDGTTNEFQMIYKYDFRQESHIGEEDGLEYVVYTYANVVYRTTAAEEAVVDALVRDLLPEIQDNTKDTTMLNIFRTATAIPYDYYHLDNDPAYVLEQTAYGALVRGTTVCEGYSALIYRLALECGIDCRIVNGCYSANNENGGHAWNYVKLDDDSSKYYIVDATNDLYMSIRISGDTKYYIPWEGCMEEGFVTSYPVATTPYRAKCDYDYDSSTGTLTVRALPAILKRTVWESGDAQWTFTWPASIEVGTKKVILDESITQIGDYAFNDFENLEEITLPETVTRIGARAFMDCGNLVKINFPDALTTIGESAFANCSSLNEITLTENSGLTDVGEKAFASCSSLTAFPLENTKITTLSNWMFESAGLEKAYVPDGITTIGEGAFYGCKSLKEAVISDDVIAIGDRAFNYSTLGKVTFSDNSRLDAVGKRAFAGTKLQEFVFPASVTSIGEEAFSGSTLHSVALPEGITTIRASQFKDCLLRSVCIPDSVRSIEDNAFDKCLIEGLYIPESVESIGTSAFSGVVGAITVDANNESFFSENGVLYTADKTRLIRYPSAMTETEYHIPDTVTVIDSAAFYNNRNLQSVEIPNTVTEIGDSAFAFCRGLVSIEIPDSVEKVGDSAFESCSSLTSATLGKEIRVIPVWMFKLATKLKTVSFGAGVQEINEAAFRDCPIETVNYEGTEDAWNKIKIHAWGNSALTDAKKNYGTVGGSNAITITLDAAGGSADKEYLTLENTASSYEGLPTPTREGCEFYGWFTKAEGGVQISENDALLIKKDHTLYAHWEDTVVLSGSLSDTVLWAVHSTGELSFYGTGAIDGDAEWRAKRSDITSVSIEGDITAIRNGGLLLLWEVKELVIPEGVKEIGTNALAGCTGLTKITLPESLETIGQSAFGQREQKGSVLVFPSCKSLTSITIPKNVTNIGNYAFSKCTGLKEVIFEGENSCWLGTEVFRGCTALEKVTVRAVGERMFQECSALRSVTMTNAVTRIGDYAFQSCASLETLTVPNSVKEIGKFAFSYDPNLKTVVFGEGITSLSDYLFFECTALEEVVFPAYCIRTGIHTFNGCTNLKTVTIPGTVHTIGRSAFASCSALETVNWGGTKEEWQTVFVDRLNEPLLAAQLVLKEEEPVQLTVSFDAAGGTVETLSKEVTSYELYGELPVPVKEGFSFKGWYTAAVGGKKISADTRVTDSEDHTLYAHWSNVIAEGTCGDDLRYTVSENGVLHIFGTGEMYDFAAAPWDAYKERITALVFDDGATNVSEFAFKGCVGIEEIRFPASVTSIAPGALAGCKALRYVRLPDGISEIADDLFSNCDFLQALYIPDSVTRIGARAFDSCTSLTAIELPDGVTQIDERAFQHTGFATIGLPNSLTQIGKYAFQYSGLVRIDIPDSVTSIGAYAFKECHSLTSVRLPNGLTEVADYLFYSCRKLPGIVIPDSVTRIGDYAFYICEKLEKFEFPDSVTSIGANALSSCRSLESARLPNGISEIPASLFSDCPKLQSIVIPDSVTRINDFAFNGCSSLGKLELQKSVTYIGKQAFRQVPSDIHVTASNAYIGGWAFWDAKGNIYIPDSADIQTGAFSDMQGTLVVTCDTGVIPSDFVYKGQYNSARSGVASLEIGSGITEIENGAFASCTNLARVTLPDTLTTLGDNAFDQCTALEEIKLCEGLKTVGASCFNSAKLTHITIPASVTSLGSSAFANNTSLTEIVLLGRGDTCTIGENAFAGTTATVYCPDEQERETPTWTEETRQNYGGTLTWQEWYTLGNTPDCQHEFISESVSAETDEKTCSSYTLNKCTICGYSYRTDFKAGQHSYTEEVIAPTCTEAGYTIYTCSRCGDTYTQETEALGHEYTSAVTEPTCTEGGYTTHTCARCGNVYTDAETEALGHDYEAVVTEPTCTEGGYTTHTCARCGDAYTDSETEAAGHRFGEWQIDTAATCTETGRESRSCSACGFSEERTVDALGHSYEAQITEPTCTDGGYTTYTCSRCGDSYTGDETPARGHIYGEWQITTPATCTESGERASWCVDCGDEKTEAVEALGHDYAAAVTAPTCTEGGYTTHTCTRCKESYVDTATDALGHDYEAAVTEPTCTAAGFTTHTCTRCGESYTDGETEALGHKYGEWELVRKSSLTKEGAQSRSCSVCGESETEAIPVTTAVSIEITTLPGRLQYVVGTPLNLDGMVVTAYCANDTAEPVTGYSVSGYDAYITGEQVITVTYEGLLASFSVTVMDAVPGDMNGDGIVTDDDALYVLMHTFFPDAYPVVGGCDFDGDGVVTDNDALYLLMHTFFPEDYPLY